MPNYKMSFWNYVHTGDTHIDIPKAVADWDHLGMNLPMSFFYSEKKGHDKKLFIQQLDECQKYGMKVVLDDERTDFRTLSRLGEEEYRKGVQRAVADFASHPATYGFHIGDEPSVSGGEWEIAKKAYQICKECAPQLNHFINMLPYWDDGDDSFSKTLGCKTSEEYSEMLTDFCKSANVSTLSYDYYGQCCYFNTEKYLDIYFKNLKIFGEASRNSNADFYTTLLCVGHWSLRVPNEDDIRWQLFTSIASGVVGISWFFLYERHLDSSFRNSPIDLYWEKTQTYEYLSRQCRIARDYYFPMLQSYNFLYAKHFYKAYGGYEEFVEDEDLEKIEFGVNPSPLIVTKFQNNDGKILFAITNNNQKEPVSIHLYFRNKMNRGKAYCWLAPGQMRLFLSWDK